MDNKNLSIITRFLVWIVMMSFITGWALNLFLRIIIALSGIISIICLSYIYHKQRLKKQEMQNSINTLKNAYNELDEQAKMVARTDLELNKTQEELDKKITGLYTLHNWGSSISQCCSIEELSDSITPDFVKQLGFEKALVILVNEQVKKLQIKKAINYSSEEISRLENEVNTNTVFPKILSKAEAFLINKIETENNLTQILSLNSFVSAPIQKQNTPIGLVIAGINSPYNKVTEGDMELVSIFASQLGIAVQNTTLYEQLWKEHHELENRIKQRTQELAQANEELKQMNKNKSDFVSSVTHELRTPLTSIKGFTSILIEGKLGKIPEEQLERLKKIQKHSSNLAQLINNLLDISRIESGRVEMDKDNLSVKDILSNVMEIITPQAKSKNIKILQDLIPENIEIFADLSQIERVFMNLLGNAVKFTPKKGKITIQVKENNSNVEFKIQDTGPGIQEKDIPFIFEEFYRADIDTDHKQRGSGLGLSLVKRIIEAHKGTIKAESKIGKGTIFTFTIPKNNKE